MDEASSMEGTATHEHCETCHKLNCMTKPDNETSCSMIYCPAECGHRFHQCKQDDHKSICLREKVECINKGNGCPVILTRDKIKTHLSVCPASVILCPWEWNRWPMHSPDKGWKAPMPFKNPHVKCGQIDVAFALRDQKVLMDSFKTPKKTRRVLRNALTQCYPAVPIQSHSSVLDSPTSETSLLSDDETGTPWDLNQAPPGLMQTISNQLSPHSTTNPLYSASKKTAESLTSALDYVTGLQGLKRLSEIAKMKETSPTSEQASLVPGSVNVNDSNNGAFEPVLATSEDNTANNEEDEFDIYCSEKRLYQILGVDLTMHFISAYQPKPKKMFTFLCGREFRRDEYPYHVKNYHCDIQCQLNHWFEQRCPLSYLGCTFSFQRFKSKTPPGTIVYSPILYSFGLSETEEFEADTTHLLNQLTDEEDVRTVEGRKRLREATPEIHTAYKCDSVVRVVPRYRSMSPESSPVKHGGYYDNETCQSLTDLPFEVLQKITRHLDSFSIQHLSMTCSLLQSVCCSLLDECGIVSLVWEKRNPSGQEQGQKSKWNVAYKKWQFTTGCCPVKDWKFSSNGELIHNHLKICPFNQDKNIQTEPFQMITSSNDILLPIDSLI
ncbi:hypothetical protein ACF0H5_016119 [Mactra antiquata]